LVKQKGRLAVAFLRSEVLTHERNHYLIVRGRAFGDRGLAFGDRGLAFGESELPESPFATFAFLVVLRVLIKLFFSMDIFFTCSLS